jgi:hypothetical protein
VTDLELELRDLAAHLDVPRTPALSGAVLARVAHRRRRRLTIAFAVGIAATVLAVAFAVPGSRAVLPPARRLSDARRPSAEADGAPVAG